jgi:hypothetical protein
MQVSWSFIDSWYTIGPFAPEATVFPPEHTVDLDARHAGGSSAPLSWRFLQSPRSEIVSTTMTSYSVHYAFTRLRSDRKRVVWLAFGPDDAMQAWLDGELIWDCGEHWRPWALDEGARRVTLREGESQLLLLLANWPQVGAFSVLIRNAP